VAPKKNCNFSQGSYRAEAISPTFDQFIILNMLDTEDDMDPIEAMHTHGAMPDEGNDALFAVANLGFGVDVMLEADEIEQVDQPPEPKRKKRRSHCFSRP
jgi:hypothetical protein